MGRHRVDTVIYVGGHWPAAFAKKCFMEPLTPYLVKSLDFYHSMLSSNVFPCNIMAVTVAPSLKDSLIC